MNVEDVEDTSIRERAELYFAAHPGSPSAVRRPKIFHRSKTWVVLLGENLEEGMVGYGDTIEAALHAFDARYLASLRPPHEADRFGNAA